MDLFVHPTTEEVPNLRTDEFRRLAQLVTEQLGIKMSEVKLPMLQGRLQRRVRHLGLNGFGDYISYLETHDEERTAFFDAVTTNKTDFFREPGHFEFLVQRALPQLSTRGETSTFKLWCAGCSSGEEAYTEAMVLSEYAEKNPGFRFQILATDISTRVLSHAANAIYDQERIEPIPELLRRKYLLRSRNRQEATVRFCASLREKVQFARLNFMEPSYPMGDVFDVIFIRNVMIYFDRPTQLAVVTRLCRHLRPGGFLFVGHSESLNGMDVPLRLVAPAVYRKSGDVS